MKIILKSAEEASVIINKYKGLFDCRKKYEKLPQYLGSKKGVDYFFGESV